MDGTVTETERDYLAGYDPREFPIVLTTVDSVLFTYHEDRLKVLLVQRANHPQAGRWALPGGYIDQDRDATLEDTAHRVLASKTGVVPPYIEQLGSFGGAGRDPRGWSVTIAYTALIPFQACLTHIESVTDTQWFDVARLNELELGFDHEAIIDAGRERFRQKALYSLVPAHALQEPFSLADLRRVHELLIGMTLSRKSFIRRVEESGALIETGDEAPSGRGRPSKLYRRSPHLDDYRFIRNIGK
ncbi:NUDIX hydrolase [Saccharospirillum salsuginis]|uniref:NUDIX hydrolase n=1 Tax=Saccharospirillum salsuginis TaxID=418750 RepID=A0A918KBR0_9GAMM|nr:NUDIX domain-containing protein [Saccharospirillum salsuginis]GGX57759.1 NUDIX hydrolase [Saccharospirillum salsuginis]